MTKLTAANQKPLKADFLSSQKPLAASYQVLASSQNDFLSSHLNEHRSSWSFKQRQLNQAITITLQLTEHANTFLNTYPVIVFSYLYLQPFFVVQGASNVSPLQPSDSPAILNILNYHCHCIVTWHLLAANSKLVKDFQPSS